ncbi:MAG: hypothetical protein KIT61_12685 [Pyrinomonadaceae bacterium]|nr:hypothetical protein [Pyrinomonadaceae bacterium]
MPIRRRKFLIIVGLAGVLATAILIAISAPYMRYFWGVFIGEHLQTSISPSGEYTAVLRQKLNLADFNFTVYVDGQRVYTSPDLCGGDYDEKLIWSKSGVAVVLVVKGRRVFAYDAREKRFLGKGQLGDFDVQPDLKPFELDCAYPKDLDE